MRAIQKTTLVESKKHLNTLCFSIAQHHYGNFTCLDIYSNIRHRIYPENRCTTHPVSISFRFRSYFCNRSSKKQCLIFINISGVFKVELLQTQIILNAKGLIFQLNLVGDYVMRCTLPWRNELAFQVGNNNANCSNSSGKNCQIYCWNCLHIIFNLIF